MNEISHILRKAVIDLITPMVVGGVTIPVFDEKVNPNVTIPDFMGSKSYVLITNQQEVETTNDKCGPRQNALITLDCICKFPPNVGSKYAAELISAYIQPLMTTDIIITGWQVISVNRVNAQSIPDDGVNNTAYRKILTYSFDVYEIV